VWNTLSIVWLIVLPCVTCNPGGWERMGGLKASRASPTIELRLMEDKWADVLHFTQFLCVPLLPTNHVPGCGCCHEKIVLPAGGEWLNFPLRGTSSGIL
jgi:hypothetical protein